MKYSKQRQAIKQVVYESYDHPTVETIYHRAQQIIPNISLGTVYRNLNRLAQDGEILKLNLAIGNEHFDHTTYPHSHITCRLCQGVSDANIEFQIKGINDHSYQEVEYHVELSGICQICQKKKEGKRR